MPLASDYVNAPTYSWMQRSAQITEFQVLKDTVKKLERASREQLLLENESQGAFDHLAAEVVKLRDAVSTLSRVVDEELLELRNDNERLRKEVREVSEAGKREAIASAEAVAAERRHATEIVALGVEQLQGSMAKADEELRVLREHRVAQSQELTRLETKSAAEVSLARQAAQQQAEALSERLGAAEAVGSAIKEELDVSLRHEHAELLRWRDEARTALGGLRTDLDDARKSAEAARAHAEAEQAAGQAALRGLLEAQGAASELALAESVERASAERQRQRDAIELLVESLATAEGQATERAESLGARIDENAAAATELVGRSVHEARAELAGEIDTNLVTCRDALRAIDGRTRALEEAEPGTRSALARHADRLRSCEGELSSLKQEGAAAAAQSRALKAGSKEAGEAVSAHKQQVRRQLDEMDRRHVELEEAIGSLADALKLANPLAAGFSSAAAAAL